MKIFKLSLLLAALAFLAGYVFGQPRVVKPIRVCVNPSDRVLSGDYDEVLKSKLLPLLRKERSFVVLSPTEPSDSCELTITATGSPFTFQPEKAVGYTAAVGLNTEFGEWKRQIHTVQSFVARDTDELVSSIIEQIIPAIKSIAEFRSNKFKLSLSSTEMLRKERK